MRPSRPESTFTRAAAIIPQWQKLVTLLTECLRTGAEGHRAADFAVDEVEFDHGKLAAMSGGVLQEQDPEAFVVQDHGLRHHPLLAEDGILYSDPLSASRP